MPMADLISRPLAEIAGALCEKRATAQELTEQAIGRHDQFGERLHAYLLWTPDRARAVARAADAAFAAGAKAGPLQGIPISIKDLFAAGLCDRYDACDRISRRRRTRRNGRRRGAGGRAQWAHRKPGGQAMSGQGTVRRRGDNRWEVRYQVSPGKTATETVRGEKRDAEKRLRILLKLVDEGASKAPTRETLNAWLARWLAAKKAITAASTHQRYTEIATKTIGPAIGDVPLGKLTPDRIAEFYADLATNGR
jgi:hypothetical protein